MQTEFPEKYRILGLKIAYYRKKAGYTQEVFQKRSTKASIFLRRLKGQVQQGAYRWKRCSKWLLSFKSRLQSCWKMTERNCRQHKAAVPLEGGGFACSGQFHASVWLNDTQHTGERIHRHCLMISQQVYYVGRWAMSNMILNPSGPRSITSPRT